MSATIALLFLAEAATTCGPVKAIRLGAGASFAPAVLNFDRQPFDPAALAPAGLNQRQADRPVGAAPEMNPADRDAGTMQCSPAPGAIA